MGAELQTLWEPVSGLQFNVNATYVDSEVTGSFIASSPFGAPIDLKGEAFPYTAEIQGLADVSYTFSLSDNLEGSLGTSVTYRGDSTARFGGGSVYTMNAYALLDLRAGIKTTDGRYGVDIWGRNVTDEHYLANITTNADTVFGLAGQPATYGVRGTVHF